MPAADAIAYSAADASARQACPQHKDQLDRRQSNTVGRFETFIDAKYQTYFAVYCATGFAARQVPTNDNRAAGDVSPAPVKLFPTQAKLTDDRMDPLVAAREAITRVLDDLTRRVQSLRNADAVGFARARTRLSRADDRILSVLENRSPVGTAQPAILLPQQTVPETFIARGLDDATNHLRYFASVAEGPYFAAMKVFLASEQAAIEQLRMRTSTPLAN